MADVVTINNQGFLDWLKANGPTLTHEFAQRFRLEHKQARGLLKAYAHVGLVTCKEVSFCGGGKGYEWKVTERH